MRPVELESRLEKGSGPPRSAASLGDQGVGHSLSARSSAAEIQTGLRIAIAYLPADRIWINPRCDLKIFRHAEVEPALGSWWPALARSGHPRPHIPEVGRSNPPPATTKILVRPPFDVTTRGSRSFLAAIWQQTSEHIGARDRSQRPGLGAVRTRITLASWFPSPRRSSKRFVIPVAGGGPRFGSRFGVWLLPCH
jgi:hypothetical protein